MSLAIPSRLLSEKKQLTLQERPRRKAAAAQGWSPGKLGRSMLRPYKEKPITKLFGA
jgi:hypothetical protein